MTKWYAHNDWTPTSWPTVEHEYWWMEYLPNGADPLRIDLVRTHAHGDGLFLVFLNSNDCISRPSITGWDARFLPCPIPPEFPERDDS